MRRPQTVYKICASALLCVSASACGSESEPAVSDATLDSTSSGGDGNGGGGMGGADAAEDPLKDPGDEPPVDLTEPPSCPESTSGFATEVVEVAFGEGQDFGRDKFPEQVLGGPRGGGLTQGSLHVTSLGDGGSVVLGFGPRTIVDGEGPDFIVFENAFYAGGNPDAPVAELGQVAVSLDGVGWQEFPCEPSDEPPYPGCSGWTPILANVTDAETADPFDPESAGGEAYDLADVGLSEAKFVRITDLAGDDVVFDLDAVAIVNGRCE